MLTPLLLALAAQAAPPAASAQSPWEITRFHRIHLRNGAFIDGQLLENGSRQVVLQIKAGRFGVRRDEIDHVEYVTMKSLKALPPVPAERKAAPAADLASAEAPVRPVPSAAAPAPGSAGLRGRVDQLLAEWSASREEAPFELTPRLLALGPDAVAYSCWLVANRVENTPVREIIVAVAGTDHPAVVGALEVVARHGSADEQLAAVEALEFSGRPAAAALLMKLLGSPSGQVWRAASESLLRLHRKGLLQDPGLQLARHLEQEAEKAPYAITLAKIGDPESRRALLEFARFAAPEDRAPVLQGVALLENPEDADLALPLLGDGSAQVRRDACEFLGRIKSLPSCPILIERLQDDEPAVVDSALWALRRISGEKFGSDPDLWTRWWEGSGSKLNAAQPAK